MSIREKTPERILVNDNFLKIAIRENESQKEADKKCEVSFNVLLALAGGLTSCLLTLIPSWGNWDTPLKVLMSIISLGFFVGVLWCAIKYFQTRSSLKGIEKKDLYEHIIDETKKKIRYTALLIITYQKAKTGDVKFMTEKQGNYIIHCDMDPYKTIEEQKEGIINYLATSYSIQKNHIEAVKPLSTDPFFDIKLVRQEETQNGFVFFQIKMKKRAKQDLVNHRSVSWKTIKEMEDIPELMGRNQHIVMALKELQTKIEDSFENHYGPMHIIWNITTSCPYGCAFCATGDNKREELSLEKQLQVLNHILTAKANIGTLDFAGGDPMYNDKIRAVIMQAIHSLGEDRISVTTTGKGIQALSTSKEEDMTRLLGRCEITIDASHENLASPVEVSTFSRNSPEYCAHNLEQIQYASENLQHLMINIPLLDSSLSEEEIDNLISKLVKLKKDYSEIKMEAQIIRLMPVGAFARNTEYCEKYSSYNPVSLAKVIKNRIDEIGIPCRYHCSLRILPQMETCEERCNMLDRKIGIDCCGNVFACTWGAYLVMPDGDITNNPFYLGNLVQSSLKNILEGQDSRTAAFKRISHDISHKAKKQYCEAVSWYFQKKVDENHDPLAQ